MNPLYLALAALCLVGCDVDQYEQSKANVEKLQLRESKLQTVVQRYETQRDGIREEIAKLRVLKGGLEDPGPVATVVTNQPIVTNQVVVVNQISSFEAMPDNRVSDRLLMINHFKSSEVFALPYSPHEFIVKSNDVVFYACKESNNSNTTNVYAVPIFK